MEVIVGATRPAGKDARLTTKGRPYGLLKIWIRIPQSFPQFVPHQRSGYFDRLNTSTSAGSVQALRHGERETNRQHRRGLSLGAEKLKATKESVNRLRRVGLPGYFSTGCNCFSKVIKSGFFM
jgi:hypothetical protein